MNGEQLAAVLAQHIFHLPDDYGPAHCSCGDWVDDTEESDYFQAWAEHVADVILASDTENPEP